MIIYLKNAHQKPRESWKKPNGLIGLTFVISLSVALLHEHTESTTGTNNPSSLTSTTGAVTAGQNTTAATTVKPATVNTTATQTQNTIDAEPIPDFELFLLYSEADPANPSAVKSDPLPQGDIAINGTDTIYYNIVLRNKEKDYVRCDGDRITTINKGKDEDDTYYSKLKLDPFEKEELPNSISGVGDIEVEWIFSCRFEGRLKEETNKAKFSFTLEGE
ncbi:hypothetical protein HYT58_03005 [Candidatus Woesearchaeota archaeon]|nr:hypothetical protein [Candidatus Woesearchaeota archaeon]